MNPYIIGNEFYRVFRNSREIFLSQGFNLLIAGIFAFMLHDLRPLYPQIGTAFYWFAQSFSLLLLSNHLFKKDLHQGFILNVLNSQTSLSGFLVSRWVAFTITLTLCTGLMSPLLLLLLSIPFENWLYFLLLLLPFNGIVGAYGGLLSLLMEGSRSYLLPFLLLPLILPLFILSIGGASHENFISIFLLHLTIMFFSLPFIIGISSHILHYLCESF